MPPEISGTISPLPQGGALYIVFEYDAPVFVGTPGLGLHGGNAFGISFTPDVNLAPGTYSGYVNIRLFQDAGHTQEFKVHGGRIPYSLTVAPELIVTAKIDGVDAGVVSSSSSTPVSDVFRGTIYWTTPVAPASTMTLKPGQVLELNSTIPVTWTHPNILHPFDWQTPPSTLTATTLVQTVPDIPAGHTGLSTYYIAMPVGGVPTLQSQLGAGFAVTAVPVP